MSETVLSIVSDALRKLKVTQSGETPEASEAEDGRIALNDILEEWNNQPLMQPSKTRLSQVLTSSATYTFGTGGDNSTRPVSISNAYIRSTVGNVDYPLQIIGNDEYSLIPAKSISSSIPYALYYRAGYPLGVVNLYPAPMAGTTLYLECQSALSTYDNVSDVVDLPPGYIKALKCKLAIAISPEYKEPPQVVFVELENAISWIKRMNAKDKPVMFNAARAAVGYGGRYMLGMP